MQNPVMMLSVHGTTHQYSGIGYPWTHSRTSIYIHVHFKNGSALNKDGTWKNGKGNLTNDQKQYLKQNGWNIE